ncbi:dissimilatory-type sulfite reductase subunit alpha [Dissulfurirhabdus thermomarina]|uniref:Dissimilatory-type sulfite reductase subunit alpha n=1 Tax=Dissulfurirhabdus thermomarina TaxID=1765737 RepID=A0A6N9TKK4_DISTH|nr:dissimilatory-type sulfite reductase subunit alpha [Dissulfurirhabdus thermomarina]NDY41775.1 dissimilatory-type sulfite reductase subunit alpha [Dissulfurirhabdus thermomarina]NMX23983.1 dissimilatory-type sulfite reductase subunit alpha [Dissulfurirhabdus thermomarina]
MADVKKHNTPMVDELKGGSWPSFVDDIEQKGLKGKQECLDLLGQLELSYEHKETHWKHGGIVGVFGYGGGVIGRYSDVPEKFPSIAHFHTIRLNQPSSKFYNSDFLRKMCDMWDHRGSGMTNLHGSTGDIVLLGTKTDELEPIFYDCTHQLGADLGGSGSNLRTPSCCVGKARCEYSCLDTQDICNDLTQTYQDELHRPAFPYKFKFKVSGCPNDCVAAIARSDCAIIGTWKDDIRIDQAAVQAYIGGELKPNAGAHSDRDWGPFDIQKEVIDLCPTNCMWMEGKELKIDNRECTRCMHCINVMPAALRPGVETGATILVGAKAPILEGAQLATLAIPFIRMESPYDELKDFVEKVWDWWMEEGKNRERFGELIQRQSIQEFLRRTGLKPIPQMVKEPRSNPYVFWSADEVEGGWERDVKAFRARHAA